MMPWSLPDGPDSYVKLIHAVDRKAFGVHLDVCNVINTPDRFYRNSEVISECFQKLRPWIFLVTRKTSLGRPRANTTCISRRQFPGGGR